MKPILFTVLCLTIASVSYGQEYGRGIDAKEGQFKYHAIVYYVDKQTGRFSTVSCGGAIINEWYVLSSAACMKQYVKNLNDFVLYFGTTNIYDKQQNRMAAEIIIPERFGVSEGLDDIALIRTTEKIEFSENVQPISLPTSADVFEGTLVSSGFGIRFVS